MNIVYVNRVFAVWGGLERIWTDKMNALSEVPGNKVCLVTTDQGDHKVPFPLNKQVRHINLGIRFTQQYHYKGLNIKRDLGDVPFTDIAKTFEGAVCPVCGKHSITIKRGIEVGNIFQLGTKYTKAMDMTYLDNKGEAQYPIMGCYGIGISRTAAAAVEAHYDEHGIKWPVAIAPYHVVIVPVNVNDELQMNVAEKMYKDLQAAGIEVVLDDRDERAGVKFKDADLIGFPYRVTVGKTISEGLVEYKIRETDEQEKYTPEEATQKLISSIKSVLR